MSVTYVTQRQLQDVHVTCAQYNYLILIVKITFGTFYEKNDNHVKGVKNISLS